jgi:hypothetical protein
MADNSIPTSYDPIVQLLEDAADGAHTHGAAIGLVHNDEAHIRADLIAHRHSGSSNFQFTRSACK